MMKKIFLGLFAATFLIFGASLAFAQECAEGRGYEEVTQKFAESTGTTAYSEMKEDFVKHFSSAYLAVTGAEVPEGIDLLQAFPMESAGLVALVAYKDRCALGSALIPLSTFQAVLQKMRENRADNS